MFFCCGKISDVIEPTKVPLEIVPVPEPEPVAVEDVVPDVEEDAFDNCMRSINNEEPLFCLIAASAIVSAIYLFYSAAKNEIQLHKDL